LGEFRLHLSYGELLMLDGYARQEPEEEDIAFEFLGCAWHGHSWLYYKIMLCIIYYFSLYKPHEICLNGKTALYNNDKIKERRRLIKEEGMRPLMIWECQARKQLEEDEEMALFFNEMIDTGPLFPRDAFHVIFLSTSKI